MQEKKNLFNSDARLYKTLRLNNLYASSVIWLDDFYISLVGAIDIRTLSVPIKLFLNQASSLQLVKLIPSYLWNGAHKILLSANQKGDKFIAVSFLIVIWVLFNHMFHITITINMLSVLLNRNIFFLPSYITHII